MKEAMFYKKMKDSVLCCLCPRECNIKPELLGFCGVRQNNGGKLYSLVYGKAICAGVDPIEKKPFFHFAPGSRALSIATIGCNLRCQFCQNWQISQTKDIKGDNLPPKKLIEMVEKDSFINGISWTYTEPTIFYEYFYDTALISRKKKLNKYHTWVSNGFTSPDAIKKASCFLDAVNIDYKGPDPFYRKNCSAWLDPVRESLLLYKKLGIWIEVTNLIIPGENDKDSTIKEMCEWIVNNLGQVPLHFSMYFPQYKFHAPPTSIATLERAYRIAKKAGLDYVYIGNVRSEKENTFCPKCNAVLIKRFGYFLDSINLNKRGKNYYCPNCDEKIPLAGMKWAMFNKEG